MTSSPHTDAMTHSRHTPKDDTATLKKVCRISPLAYLHSFHFAPRTRAPISRLLQGTRPAARGAVHDGGREDAEGGGVGRHAERLPEGGGAHGAV